MTARFGMEDRHFMRAALDDAEAARGEGEVPVGAVVVVDGEIIGRGHNRPIGANDPTAHAEIVAIRDAAKRAGSYRLTEARIYVTLEPCVMCVGAIIHARLRAVIFGAYDEKAGALGSVYDIGRDGQLNHRIEVYPGLMAAECGTILREFFQARRAQFANK